MKVTFHTFNKGGMLRLPLGGVAVSANPAINIAALRKKTARFTNKSTFLYLKHFSSLE